MPRRNHAPTVRQRRRSRAHVRGVAQAKLQARWTVLKSAGRLERAQTIAPVAGATGAYRQRQDATRRFAAATGQAGPVVFVHPEALRHAGADVQAALGWVAPGSLRDGTPWWLWRSCRCAWCRPASDPGYAAKRRQRAKREAGEGLADWERDHG